MISDLRAVHNCTVQEIGSEARAEGEILNRYWLGARIWWRMVRHPRMTMEELREWRDYD